MRGYLQRCKLSRAGLLLDTSTISHVIQSAQVWVTVNAAFVVATTTALVAFTLRETHIRVLRFTLQMRCRVHPPSLAPQPLLTFAAPLRPALC